MLEELDEVSELREIVPSLYLQWRGPADLEDKVSVLEADALLLLSWRQFSEVLVV